MSLEQRSISLDISKYKPGLIFDAEGVTLVGKHTDELSAHRAKRQWIEVLHNYFLLERERDYDLKVVSFIDENYFALLCSFSSACGRYAFWRLINHQAPEAEEKLGGSIKNGTSRRVFQEDIAFGGEKKTSWVLSPLQDAAMKNQETQNLLQRIIKLFQQ